MKKGFTIIEILIVIFIIIIIIGISSIGIYHKIKWTAHVIDHGIQNRGRLNQAAADGKFKNQKKFQEEQDRLKRQIDNGLQYNKR